MGKLVNEPGKFQSTLPRRERPQAQHNAAPLPKDFNPCSREGSDLRVPVRKFHNIQISIHAPVKGATEHIAVEHVCTVISIHAPVKGATCAGGKPRAGFGISIHAPAKGATKKRDNGVDHRSISIHAPAKGATSVRYLPHASQTDFNPRSREGSDAHG